MRFSFHGYDLTLAVVARRTLLFEPSTDQQRFRQVWQPLEKFLDKLGRRRPRSVTCFASERYHFPKHSAGTCANVYAVNADREVAYLGTVFSRQAEANDRASHVVKLMLADYDQASLFEQHGSTSIIREQCFCRIPAFADELTKPVLTDAVRRYFLATAPSLANTAVVWLSDETGATLDRWIAGEARRTAKPSVEPPRVNPDDIPWGY